MVFNFSLTKKLSLFFFFIARGTALFLEFFLSSPKAVHISGAPNDNFRKNICSEDDLRSRIFEIFVVKFLACLPLLGFSNIKKMV